MCRRNQLAGACGICFGLGLLIATCFESLFLCGCVGVIFIGVGFFGFVRK